MSNINEEVVRSVLDQYCLIFSPESIRMIVRAAQDLTTKRRKPETSKATNIQQLKELKEIASELSAKLRKYYPHLEDDPEDKFLPTLNGWINGWARSIKYYKNQKAQAGAAPKDLSKKLYVQILIYLYERETSEGYIENEGTAYGRERTSFNPRLAKYVQSILALTCPDDDPIKLMKAARREPLSLDRARRILNKIDKTEILSSEE